jgi:hypothetical protein
VAAQDGPGFIRRRFLVDPHAAAVSDAFVVEYEVQRLGGRQGSPKYNTISFLVNLEIKELIDAGSTSNK